MTNTVDSLDNAARKLREALEQYVSVCSTIPSCFTFADRVRGGSRLLSERVIDEIQYFDSYSSSLNKAKSMLAQGRNSCTAVVPINGLPDELLAQIFRMVLWSPSYPREKLSRLVENFTFPQYPDLLLRVCSRWRRAAVNSRIIWSHIDLAPSNPHGPRLIVRANTFAGRAGPNPLSIRVFYPNDPLFDFDRHRRKYERFFDSFGKHIQSLEFVAQESAIDRWKDDDGISDEVMEGDKILESCLRGCVPGVLDRLTIVGKTSPESRHLEFGQSRPSRYNAPADTSHDSLEDHWASIKILWLDSLYPPWTSKAYKDLVELHLVSEHDENSLTSITEVQLVAILKSSPMLRILQLKLTIEPQAPRDPPITPVRLEQLETLELSLQCRVQPVSLFRWIVVGSLPLRMSIETVSAEEEFLANPWLQSFFERSRIASLRLRALEKTHELSKAFHYLPHLRVLVLQNCLLRKPQGFEIPRLTPGEQNGQTPLGSLHRVYLLGCNGTIEDSSWLEERPIRTLVLQGNRFSYQGSYDRAPHNTFSKILPATNIIIPAANFSTDNWDDLEV